ncbi:hypothetical protein, partial [Pseudogemmobacter bohemicus]|uniref:hypothetical protein n=1 Tax=Pseudogemmobacter bohemicus TaxID=2250708 RepID=UPI0018E56369
MNQLESIDEWGSEPNAQSVQQLLTIVINAETMLPAAVKKHFRFPNPYVRDDHERRNQDYRNDLTNRIIAANRAGLDSADADPSLRRGGGADLSDRPRSQGELILEMLTAFEETRSSAAFHRLYAAVSPTTLQGRIRTIEMLMKRKKPYGNQSPE